MIENISNNSEIVYTGVREEGASLPPSSKVQEPAGVQKSGSTEADTRLQKDTPEGNQPTGQEVEIDVDELNEAIDRLNEKLYLTNREVLFKTERKINKHYISVIDKNSQEVIKEFPPKEIRKFLIGVKELEDKLGSSRDIKSLIVNLEV